jgi:hypothetical protein
MKRYCQVTLKYLPCLQCIRNYRAELTRSVVDSVVGIILESNLEVYLEVYAKV